MCLSKVAILALKGLGLEARKRLAAVAGVHITTLNRWIVNNDDNLTKAALSEAISQEIGLPVSEILEKEAEAITKAALK